MNGPIVEIDETKAKVARAFDAYVSVITNSSIDVRGVLDALNNLHAAIFAATDGLNALRVGIEALGEDDLLVITVG